MHRLTRSWSGLALILSLAGALPAAAQETGRTDGPEGSEIGKGGYSRKVANFSLQLDFGGSLSEPAARESETPLTVGATFGLWGPGWYTVDASVAYLFDTHRFDVLVGPRFRIADYPISPNAGLKAGLIALPNGDLRFGLSPQAGIDFLMGNNEQVLLGLNWAFDIPVGGPLGQHRLFLNVGYRF